jgi:hypothetical protein
MDSWFQDRRKYHGKGELHEMVDEILTSLSIEMIEIVSSDWMDRIQRVIDGNGEHVA